MSVEGTLTNMLTGTVGTEIPESPAIAEVATTEAVPAESVTPAPAAAEPAKPKERSADRFASLARKEAEVYRKAQAIRQQQAELARQAEEIKNFQALKSKAVLNPLDALKELGLTYEQVTEYVLNDNKPTPSAEVLTLKQELEEFKRQNAERESRQEQQRREMAEREQRQIITAFRDEVNEYVSQHAETYELTSLYNGAYLVSDVIEQNFKDTGKLLSIPEAAKMVEEYYEDLGRKTLATKKFAATKQDATPAQVETKTPAAKMPPTLSNDLSASVTAASQRPRSDAERIAAALARLEGR